MNKIRKNIIYRLFWVLIVINLINLSIDPPDLRPFWEPEDLTVNEMESIIEVVLEIFLGIDDAISEHDEQGDESIKGYNIKHFSIYCFSLLSYDLQPITLININPFTFKNTNFKTQFFGEPTSPPPKFKNISNYTIGRITTA